MFVYAEHEGPYDCSINEREGPGVCDKRGIAAAAGLVPLVPQPTARPEET